MFGLKRKSKRDIFRYWDGERWRGADPVLVVRKLSSHPLFSLEKHPVDLQSNQLATQNEAIAVTVGAMRDVFGVKPWDDVTDKGLTERETLALFHNLLSYLEGVKKNGSGPPT